jgi:hypothetical protein
LSLQDKAQFFLISVIFVRQKTSDQNQPKRMTGAEIALIHPILWDGIKVQHYYYLSDSSEWFSQPGNN